MQQNSEPDLNFSYWPTYEVESNWKSKEYKFRVNTYRKKTQHTNQYQTKQLDEFNLYLLIMTHSLNSWSVTISFISYCIKPNQKRVHGFDHL